MILTTDEVTPVLTAWRRHGTTIDDDTAQTLASWWYSPSVPAMVTLATRGMVLDRDRLRCEVQEERDRKPRLPDWEREELDALLAWIDREEGLTTD